MDEMRTMIAAMALQGLLAALALDENWEPEELVDIPVSMADKLLERLNA